MKLILKQDVANVGDRGDVVEVKDGYGRNFLIPQGLAVFASKSAIKSSENEEKQVAKKRELDIKNAEKLAEKITSTSITIPVKAGEDGKIFGTITTQQIADALAEKGLEIDRRKITISSEVKSLGEYVAVIALTGSIKPELKIWVVKEEE
jgi:large subunit ribosomal protein L9